MIFRRLISSKTRIKAFSLKQKIFTILVVSCLVYFMIFRYNLVNNLKNVSYLKTIHNEKIIESKKETLQLNQACLVPNLNEWDPKIKNMFKNLPIYSNCTKSEPFTYVINSTIFFNSNVNETFYKGK